jgi:hypothetical protein
MLIRKPERKRLLRRPRHKWEDNIKMVLKSRVFQCELDLTMSG